MKHYIVIEVEEPERARGEPLDLGKIRKHFHAFVMERGMKVFDVVFREDRWAIPGTRRPTRYKEVREIFEETMSVARGVMESHRKALAEHPVEIRH